MINFGKKLAVKNIIELILMVFLYAVLDNVGGLKKYAIVLAFCIVFFFLGRKKKWSVDLVLCIAIPVFAYVMLGSLSTLLRVNVQSTAFKIILYWLVPLMFAFSLYTFYGDKTKHIVDIQFLGSILAYALFDAPYLMKIFRWESVFAFVFGIFAIYFAYYKRWKLFVVAMLFLIFAEKRIAILAVMGALLVMGVVWLFRHNQKLILGIWATIVAAIFSYLYLIYSGVMEAFCWGANINTNGRVEIYARVAEEFPLTIMGNGLGIVEKMLEYWNVAVYSNLHNDLLKIFIELGVFGFFVFLLSYGVMFYFAGKRFEKSKLCFLLGIVVYTMLLFATDNVSIYMVYLVPFYSTIFAVLSTEEKKTALEDLK